jgi:hypothetical protein
MVVARGWGRGSKECLMDVEMGGGRGDERVLEMGAVRVTTMSMSRSVLKALVLYAQMQQVFCNIMHILPSQKED